MAENVEAGGRVIPESFISYGGFLPPKYLSEMLSGVHEFPPLSRRTRFRRWRRECWYDLRKAVAMRILPDYNWNSEDWI